MNLEFWEGQGFAGLQDRHTKKQQQQQQQKQKQTTKRENRQTKTNKKRGEMFS